MENNFQIKLVSYVAKAIYAIDENANRVLGDLDTFENVSVVTFKVL